MRSSAGAYCRCGSCGYMWHDDEPKQQDSDFPDTLLRLIEVLGLYRPPRLMRPARPLAA
jgi:hypothetical protein